MCWYASYTTYLSNLGQANMLFNGALFAFITSSLFLAGFYTDREVGPSLCGGGTRLS